MEILGIKIPAFTSRKILTILTFLIFLIITLKELASCINRYLDFPTYTSFQLVYQKEADFPSLTFCPTDDDAYSVTKLKVIFC